MKRWPIRLVVALTAFLCLGTAGYASQIWWAKRLAIEVIRHNYDDPGPWWRREEMDPMPFLESWEASPWYGHWSLERWWPRRFHHEMLKGLSAIDLGDDPSLWKNWFASHPRMLWARGPRRLVWNAQDLLPYLKGSDSALRVSTLLALESLQDSSVAAKVSELLDDKDSDVRCGAIDVLRVLKAKEFLPRILSLLQDPSPDIRSHSVCCLWQFGDQSTSRHLLRMLEDSNYSVRSNAGGALVHGMKDRSVIPEIEKLLESPRPEVRREALTVLVSFVHKPSASKVAKLLDDPDPETRGQAILVLAGLGSPADIPRIAEHLEDPIENVRGAAMIALRSLAKEDFSEVDDALAWWLEHQHDPEFTPR